MVGTATKQSNARQRLIETAERLFYAEGIHAVGIDRIIAEAKVAKMTLYNHFASKDELILAVLQYRDEQVGEMFDRSMAKHQRKGLNRLEAFFEGLKEWFETAGFRGCSFINAAAELPDKDHPALRFSAHHKQKIREMLKEIVLEVGGEKATAAAPAISLLVEGAIVNAVFEQSSQPAETAKEAAELLISKFSRKRR